MLAVDGWRLFTLHIAFSIFFFVLFLIDLKAGFCLYD